MTVTTLPGEDTLHYHQTMSALVNNFPTLSFVSWKINDTLISYEDLRSAVSKISYNAHSPNSERLKEMNAFVTSEFDCAHWQNIFLKKAQDQYALAPQNVKQKVKEQEIRALKNKLINEQSKAISIELTDKGKQFSTFVSQAWPNYNDCIRLSVHCDKNSAEVDKKIPISLIYGHFGTPWHNTIVVDDKKEELSGFFKDVFKSKNESLTNKKLHHFDVTTKDGKAIALEYIDK